MMRAIFILIGCGLSWLVDFPSACGQSPSQLFQIKPQAEADAGDELPGIESGKKALVKKQTFPWYDPAADDLKRIEVQSQKSSDDNQRQWQSGPTAPPVTGTTSAFWNVLAEVFRVLIYLLIAALVTTLIVILVRAFLKRESRTLSVSAELSKEEIEGEIARVENLPFQVAPPKGDLLSEAERHYQAGDYNRAIIYLFSYELVKLDQHHLIRLTRGKTNRQYLREVRSRPELTNILRQTMLAFEEVFFGHHPLDRQGFEACWQELGEFQQALGKEAAVPV